MTIKSEPYTVKINSQNSFAEETVVIILQTWVPQASGWPLDNYTSYPQKLSRFTEFRMSSPIEYLQIYYNRLLLNPYVLSIYDQIFISFDGVWLQLNNVVKRSLNKEFNFPFIQCRQLASYRWRNWLLLWTQFFSLWSQHSVISYHPYSISPLNFLSVYFPIYPLNFHPIPSYIRGRLVYDESERIWKEDVMARLTPEICLEWLKNVTTILSQGSRYPDRVSNWAYMVQVSITAIKLTKSKQISLMWHYIKWR